MPNARHSMRNGMGNAGGRRWPGAIACALHAVSSLAASAAMTQEDVFKSIKENVSESGDSNGKMFLAVVLGVAGVLMLVALINLRTKRGARAKVTNHPGKLLKEISKKIGLKPAEVKQLKLLAEGERAGGASVQNPLVFVLCPSAMVGAMRAGRARVDRKVVAGLAKKMGLVAEKGK